MRLELGTLILGMPMLARTAGTDSTFPLQRIRRMPKNEVPEKFLWVNYASEYFHNSCPQPTMQKQSFESCCLTATTSARLSEHKMPEPYTLDVTRPEA